MNLNLNCLNYTEVPTNLVNNRKVVCICCLNIIKKTLECIFTLASFIGSVLLYLYTVFFISVKIIGKVPKTQSETEYFGFLFLFLLISMPFIFSCIFQFCKSEYESSLEQAQQQAETINSMDETPEEDNEKIDVELV